MLLAAGRGERMRPLTDTMPKPLLSVAGKPLIVHHLEELSAAGFRQLVINHAWLGEQIEETLGDGSRWNLQIHYSAEAEALETGGGIFRALPLLSDPFLVINADIFAKVDFASLSIDDNDLAHLLLVENPAHNAGGDFQLTHGRVSAAGEAKLTYSGIGLYRKGLFDDCRAGKFQLAPLLRKAMQQHRVSGQLLNGEWIDVGTPQRLQQLERLLMAGRGCDPVRSY
jgi:MurNAc alpha-1-phosphate uridylyltransferase